MASRARQTLKVLLLGDAGVGKTCLLDQFVNREFTGQYKATIGSDFSSKQMDIDGRFVTLQIWDTAGQERFQSLGSTFYRGTDCCALVYDITRPASFEAVAKWHAGFAAQLGLSSADDFPFVLLGNKSDLPARAVQPSAAREFADANGAMLCFNVSAKNADNVQAAFEAVVRKALARAPADRYVIGPSALAEENETRAPKGACAC
jgi:Ras-related protein Rab-7A